jgi:hypothetical protein
MRPGVCMVQIKKSWIRSSMIQKWFRYI